MTAHTNNIRLATEDDFQYLPAVEDAAGEIFRDIGYDDIAGMPATPPEEYKSLQKKGGLIWVADNAVSGIVAFCATSPLPHGLYIKELSVHNLHMKQGLGSLLLKTALTAGRSNGDKSAFLLTFEKVPFNAPFYARFGFEIIEDLSPSPALKGLAYNERETPLWKYGRVAMKLDLE